MDCQRACIDRHTDCAGVDFVVDNEPGWKCFLIFNSDEPVNVGLTPGVTHYALASNCKLQFEIIFWVSLKLQFQGA